MEHVSYSNTTFDVHHEMEGNTFWIEFGMEYRCSFRDLVQLVQYLRSRGVDLTGGNDHTGMKPEQEF